MICQTLLACDVRTAPRQGTELQWITALDYPPILFDFEFALYVTRRRIET
jgi:hypothetical protein